VENSGDPLGSTWNSPLAVLEAGLEMIQYLGVGGMGTRGFGRMKLTAKRVLTLMAGGAQ
jgi:CRISPR-associated protein Cmr4